MSRSVSVMVEASGTTRARQRLYASPLALLAAVAVCYVVVQLVLVPRHMFFAWDETIYLSQVSPDVPATMFGAQRARGMSLLAAPVMSVTSSVAAIRGYFTVLSGVGLFLAYWPWTRLRPGRVVPLAALGFVGMWLTLFWGGAAMPNLYDAYGIVATVGLFALAMRRPGAPAPLIGLALSCAVVSLIRPTDTVWVVVPLVVACVFVRRWRRLAPFVAVAAGLAVGLGQWAVEAYVRFGGPFARLAGTSDAVGGGGGVHLTLWSQLQAFGREGMCGTTRPCEAFPFLGLTVWAGLALLAVVGVRAVRHRPYGPAVLLATAVALTYLVPYVVLAGNASSRYLMPVYALVWLAAAEGVRRLAVRRGAVAIVLAVALVGHAVLAGGLARHQALADTHDRGVYQAIGKELTRHGIRPPCLVYGSHALEVAFAARCGSRGVSSAFDPAKSVGVPAEAALRRADSRGRHSVVVLHTPKVPPTLRAWTRLPLPVGHDWYAFLPPGH